MFNNKENLDNDNFNTDINIKDMRLFLRDNNKECESDREKGVKMPPVQKPYDKDAEIIELVNPDKINPGNVPVNEVLRNRRSRRKYIKDAKMSLEELSYLLWYTQGIKGDNLSKRTVPSAGARHPFETYIYLTNVEGLKKGLYRYLPVENKLCLISVDEKLEEKVSKAFYGQFPNTVVYFIWTAIPYRMEWAYTYTATRKIAIDMGYVSQNLYITSESINWGTCAIGYFNQEELNNIVGADGDDEITLLCSTVGKPR
ncbi:MAG: SagB/ThcOx family dehydrogenase [Spirochaetota bacterium]